MNKELIAPCGINCRLCYGYIRPKNRCGGCRAADGNKPKSCASCKIVICEKRIENGWLTCADCDTPCRRLKDLEKRYRTKYHVNLFENLAVIREQGMEHFLQWQMEKYTCSACGGILCVHREVCPTCNAPAWQESQE